MLILETKCLPRSVTVSIEAHTKIEISQNNANKPFSKKTYFPIDQVCNSFVVCGAKLVMSPDIYWWLKLSLNFSSKSDCLSPAHRQGGLDGKTQRIKNNWPSFFDLSSTV